MRSVPPPLPTSEAAIPYPPRIALAVAVVVTTVSGYLFKNGGLFSMSIFGFSFLPFTALSRVGHTAGASTHGEWLGFLLMGVWALLALAIGLVSGYSVLSTIGLVFYVTFSPRPNRRYFRLIGYGLALIAAYFAIGVAIFALLSTSDATHYVSAAFYLWPVAFAALSVGYLRLCR